MKVIFTIFSIALLFSLSACGNATGGSPAVNTYKNTTSHSIPTQSKDNTNSSHSVTKTVINASSQKDSQTVKPAQRTASNSKKKPSESSQDSSNNSASSTTSSNNNLNGIDARLGAVFNATLKVESKQPNTTVDFQSYTMTQNGKKVRLTILPTSDHQKDFKEGFVKEIVNNKDESHDVTLFQYKIDNNNQLSLIDTSTEKVVYTTHLTETNNQANNQPTGPWVKTFEENLYKGYHVTPSRYKYIGNGNWEVWVKEVNTGKYPYVTVNQNTGNFHG